MSGVQAGVAVWHGWDDFNRLLHLRRFPSRYPTNVGRPPCTQCVTTCSRRLSWPSVAPKRCSQNTQHRARREVQLARPREALTSARACQEDAQRIYDQKFNEAAVAETNCENATEDVIWKAEALERHDAGGVPRDHGGRLFQNAPRAARRSQEPPELTSGMAEHRWPFVVTSPEAA